MTQHSEQQRLRVGQRIKAARSFAGISRKELESKYGISTHTLQSWELGRNPLTEKSAAKLVEILHSTGVICTTQWLLEGSGRSPSLINSDFVPYQTESGIGTLLGHETSIQKEIEYFKSNNPNAVVLMLSDDTMEPTYSNGDFVGGIQYRSANDIEECIGHDCIVEISEGTYFRRLIERKDGYALVCLNPKTQIEEPVIFSKKILAAAPVIWHRWRFVKPD